MSDAEPEKELELKNFPIKDLFPSADEHPEALPSPRAAALRRLVVICAAGPCIAFGSWLVGPQEFFQFRYVFGGLLIGAGIQAVVLLLEGWVPSSYS
jgi:hypothetical protein